MLMEKIWVNPMSRSFVECVIALKMKEARERKGCYRAKVVVRNTIGTA